MTKRILAAIMRESEQHREFLRCRMVGLGCSIGAGGRAGDDGLESLGCGDERGRRRVENTST